MEKKNIFILSTISIIVASICFFFSLITFAFQLNSGIAPLLTVIGILFMGIYGVLAKYKIGYIAIGLSVVAIILNLLL